MTPPARASSEGGVSGGGHTRTLRRDVALSSQDSGRGHSGSVPNLFVDDQY
jgi:hypothetical protein